MLIAAGEDVGLADPQAMVVVEACAAAFDRVGLPEGLYPLVHAALYLAGCEKSNSSLGFFDAVKAVRQARRQEVPSHLRDAHRDGSAFGDGVGYRYPHAYAEHWVAQRYLPAELQGQVFWQPGSLGWEGQLRQRLQQRRAAQLAAAAETALERPELLSSAPEDPLLERWLQRQAVAEGERLDLLRRRFWEGAPLGRLDRVLVLDAHSLLWALDPLQAASEGQVVISLPGEAERQRLEAQLQLLDALRRPQLLVAPARAAGLPPLLEEGMRFEWIAARQPLRRQPPRQRQAWLKVLSQLAAPGAQGRWLQSHTLQGPAGCLLEHLGRPGAAGVTGAAAGTGAAATLLAPLLPLESRWLAEDDGRATAGAGLARELERLGWQVEESSWEERLELRLEDDLLRRWFAPGAAYRQRLEQALPPGQVTAVEALFRQHRGLALPQTMGHRLLRSRRA